MSNRVSILGPVGTILLGLRYRQDATFWCYACYSLTFTFGSASGKTMIFQARDSDFGEATGGNHFVLVVDGEAVCGDYMY